VAAELAARASPVTGQAAGPAAASPAARAWLWGTVALTAGAIITAIALAPPAAAPASAALAYLLFAGSSAHVASTAWFYTVPKVRGYMGQHRARYAWTPLALIAGAGAIAAALPPAVLTWLLLPYFGWQFFHYQKQNLGLASLAAAAHGVTGLRPAERRALLAAGLAGTAGLLARPRLLQLRVDPHLAAAYPLAAAAFAIAVTAGLVSLARRPAGQRPAGFCVTYACALTFTLPAFIFSSPYAAVAGMTIAHGLQYLLLMGLVAVGGPRPGPAGTAGSRLLPLAALTSIALAGGAILSVASDLQESAPLTRSLFGCFLGAVMAHFVIDAGLWRLRDRFPRLFLESRVPYLVPGRGTASVARDPSSPASDPSVADIRSERA
jgi:hypothetical protein